MLPLLRLLKLIAVALAIGGSVGVFAVDDPASRKRLSRALVVPGVVGAWALGFWLAAETQTSLLSGWILGGLGASFFALQAVLFFAGREGRPRGASASVALSLWLVTLWLMIFRPG